MSSQGMMKRDRAPRPAKSMSRLGYVLLFPPSQQVAGTLFGGSGVELEVCQQYRKHAVHPRQNPK